MHHDRVPDYSLENVRKRDLHDQARLQLSAATVPYQRLRQNPGIEMLHNSALDDARLWLIRTRGWHSNYSHRSIQMATYAEPPFDAMFSGKPGKQSTDRASNDAVLEIADRCRSARCESSAGYIRGQTFPSCFDCFYDWQQPRPPPKTANLVQLQFSSVLRCQLVRRTDRKSVV